MTQPANPYQAYLLRLWYVREARDTWRVSLEDAQTRELRGFANLEELFAFLCKEVNGREDDEVATEVDEKDVKPV